MPFLLDDQYLIVNDSGLSRVDRKVFECPVCGRKNFTYLEEIHLPSVRKMIAAIIVNAFEDYIRDRNKVDENGRFLNQKFIKEAEWWLFEGKNTNPLSLYWCCEMLTVSQWKIQQICKRRREEKDKENQVKELKYK